MVQQPAPEGGRRQRGRIEESLDDIAAELGQQLPLPFGLDALGHDSQRQALPDAYYRRHDGASRGTALDIAHEAPVDLQFANWQMRETVQARITRSEIVERQPGSEFADRAHRLDRNRMLVQEYAFGDLEHQNFRRQGKLHQNFGDDGSKTRVLEIDRREIDRHAGNVEASVSPLRHLPAGLADRPQSDLLDQPAFLGERNELGR